MITRSLPLYLQIVWVIVLAAYILQSSDAYHINSGERGLAVFLKPLRTLSVGIICTGLVMDIDCMHLQPVNAATSQKVKTMESFGKDRIDPMQSQQSPGWELARQKRTAAMKVMQNKGIIKIDTDDSGNQYLKLPWVADKQLYKSLSITQRLQGEVFAGAIGEISKDLLLHSVDTAKTRKQVQKKTGISPNLANNSTFSIGSIFGSIKDSYSGFPIVLLSSLPQGGVFFLVKKGMVELITKFAPTTPSIISSTLPIGFGVMAYWLFRTPAEVIKTQVQTYQSVSCKDALLNAKNNPSGGIFSLWKHYNVMLTLDVPFQVLNFILLGFISDAVLHAGYETSIFTRLFCGVTCGMIVAAVTCPIDVCKTRIISRERKSAALSNSVNSVNSQVEVEVGTEVRTDNFQENLQVIEHSERSSIPILSDNDINIYDNNGNNIYNIDDDKINKEREREINWSRVQMEAEEINEINSANIQSTGTLLLAINKKEKLKNSENDIYIGWQDSVQHSLPSPEHSVPVENVEENSKIIDHNNVEKNANFENNSENNLLQPVIRSQNDDNVISEMFKIVKEEGIKTLFLGINQRLLYVGLANGIRLAAYGTSRMDLMMKNLDDL